MTVMSTKSTLVVICNESVNFIDKFKLAVQSYSRTVDVQAFVTNRDIHCYRRCAIKHVI